MTLLRLIGNFTMTYLVIGFIIGFSAWVTDESRDISSLIVVPVIALIWPFWLYLLIIFG